MLGKIVPLFIVAFLWGATNPLIKRGTAPKNVKEVKRSRIRQLIHDWHALLTNTKFVIPFGLNQLGSLLYVVCLQHIDVSIAVPVTNSMTFIFTAITGMWLGEGKPTKKTYVGMILILLGTFVICFDRFSKEIENG